MEEESATTKRAAIRSCLDRVRSATLMLQRDDDERRLSETELVLLTDVVKWEVARCRMLLE